MALAGAGGLTYSFAHVRQELLATHPHPESLLFSFQFGGTRLSSLIPPYAELKGLGPLNIRTVAGFEFTELLDYNQENKCMRYLADAEFE